MATQTGVTIVMVDDNADEIFLTRRLVRRDGIVNNFVSEKKPAHLLRTLDDLRSAGVDPHSMVLLLDINMPRMNGFETLSEIRASTDYWDLPVIMLSASEEEGDVKEAFARGANGYMVKPFTAEDFLETLGRVPQVRLQLVTAVS